jgi:hypothetical protein
MTLRGWGIPRIASSAAQAEFEAVLMKAVLMKAVLMKAALMKAGSPEVDARLKLQWPRGYDPRAGCPAKRWF